MSTACPIHVRRAPAKINLGLHVLRRRSDGFHDIESVLVPIGWHDTLTVRAAADFRFTCSDPTLPVDASNLCVRATLALAEWAGIEPHGTLHLEKRVPHGAGLGGGSSDAAHTLHLLADFWKLSLAPDELHVLASGLGSDVPFFLYDGPMLATGRGEVLHSLPYRLPFDLVVVMPPVTVSTAEAYGLVDPRHEGRADLAALVCSNDLERWQSELVNDFEEPILTHSPEIREAKQNLLEAGAGYAALSGSGSAVFGVFEREEDARQAAGAFVAAGYEVWWGGGAPHG